MADEEMLPAPAVMCHGAMVYLVNAAEEEKRVFPDAVRKIRKNLEGNG